MLWAWDWTTSELRIHIPLYYSPMLLAYFLEGGGRGSYSQPMDGDSNPHLGFPALRIIGLSPKNVKFVISCQIWVCVLSTSASFFTLATHVLLSSPPPQSHLSVVDIWVSREWGVHPPYMVGPWVLHLLLFGLCRVNQVYLLLSVMQFKDQNWK